MADIFKLELQESCFYILTAIQHTTTNYHLKTNCSRLLIRLMEKPVESPHQLLSLFQETGNALIKEFFYKYLKQVSSWASTYESFKSSQSNKHYRQIGFIRLVLLQILFLVQEIDQPLEPLFQKIIRNCFMIPQKQLSDNFRKFMNLLADVEPIYDEFYQEWLLRRQNWLRGHPGLFNFLTPPQQTIIPLPLPHLQQHPSSHHLQHPQQHPQESQLPSQSLSQQLPSQSLSQQQQLQQQQMQPQLSKQEQADGQYLKKKEQFQNLNSDDYKIPKFYLSDQEIKSLKRKSYCLIIDKQIAKQKKDREDSQISKPLQKEIQISSHPKSSESNNNDNQLDNQHGSSENKCKSLKKWRKKEPIIMEPQHQIQSYPRPKVKLNPKDEGMSHRQDADGHFSKMNIQIDKLLEKCLKQDKPDAQEKKSE